MSSLKTQFITHNPFSTRPRNPPINRAVLIGGVPVYGPWRCPLPAGLNSSTPGLTRAAWPQEGPVALTLRRELSFTAFFHVEYIHFNTPPPSPIPGKTGIWWEGNVAGEG
ncbi:hypothetical protein DPEC_G00294290 [Dallia pectoralis]|uniref:Uncharacterized protein n=1 Tax=Dallia pectoralis TaxID=75939 RepID=A0ACC2FIK9_DALPE|nr:hypothetical protein DPEC_G00294290 [Dallia pectoralis]